uniref:BHLH domain-containing protein n=1 Tax=Caenorhabditis tropicalis TaxID=1561998 RepID=A0A1I7TH34_9PELO
MFHVQMEIHSFNSDLDIKKVGLATPTVAEPSSNGEKKLMTLEERRKCLQRRHTTYIESTNFLKSTKGFQPSNFFWNFLNLPHSSTMFHVQMEIHSFNSDLDIKKAGLASPTVAEPSSNGERKLADRALEDKRRGFRRSFTTYM